MSLARIVGKCSFVSITASLSVVRRFSLGRKSGVFSRTGVDCQPCCVFDAQLVSEAAESVGVLLIALGAFTPLWVDTVRWSVADRSLGELITCKMKCLDETKSHGQRR